MPRCCRCGGGCGGGSSWLGLFTQLRRLKLVSLLRFHRNVRIAVQRAEPDWCAYTLPCPALPPQLLARRIKAAQQLEKQEEAVRGLELLYRR